MKTKASKAVKVVKAVKLGSLARECTKPTKALLADDFDTIAWADAKKRFRMLKDLVDTPPKVTDVRVYAGDVAVNRLNLSGPERGQRVIVIDGNLWVEDLLELAVSQDDDLALVVYVTGWLSAGSVVLSDDPQLMVQGDLEVENVLACGGGNLGRVDVDGSLRAALVLEWAAAQILVQQPSRARTWAWAPHNVQIPGEERIDNARDVLAAAYLAADGGADRAKVLKAIESGKSVFA